MVQCNNTSYSVLPIQTVAPKDVGKHTGYEKPVFAFLPSLAISSLATVNNFDDTWNGDILAGSLGGQTLVRMRIKENRVIFAERIPIGERIRDVQETAGGQIVLWTDANKVMFLQKNAGGLGGRYVKYRLSQLEDRTALLALADKAMFAIKKRGKNAIGISASGS